MHVFKGIKAQVTLRETFRQNTCFCFINIYSMAEHFHKITKKCCWHCFMCKFINDFYCSFWDAQALQAVPWYYRAVIIERQLEMSVLCQRYFLIQIAIVFFSWFLWLICNNVGDWAAFFTPCFSVAFIKVKSLHGDTCKCAVSLQVFVDKIGMTCHAFSLLHICEEEF